jgi:hypothetical protein
MQPEDAPGRQNSVQLHCSCLASVTESNPVIMTESRIKLVANIARAVAVVSFLICFAVLSVAQSSQPPPQAPPVLPGDKDRPVGDSPAGIEEDMRARRALKLAEKEYQQNLGRARDLSVIGEAVNASYKEKTHLSPEDFKKLEKAEKLAKAIRSAAGGSEDDSQIEQPPKDLTCALSMFAEVATSLKKNVEKTPKHVVSATVIDQANVILELARIVRTLSFQTRNP